VKTILLSQVVQINPRQPRGIEDSREISFVPMASVSEDGGITFQETRNFGEIKKGFTYFQRGDVLLAKITPCFENGKSALADNLEHPIGFGSTEFHVLRTVPEKLDSRFLYHLVRSNQLLFLGQKSMKGAAGHKRVPTQFLESFEVPAWPLDDQIRIAHLLGKVESLIAQRKQHLQQLDDLLKSVFLDMFGDPVRNEKGWDMQSCEKAVLDISSGTSYGGEDRAFLSAEEVGVLKISAVTKGTFNPTEFKVVNPAQITKALRFVRRGDFLFSRANTVGLVAACCIVERDYAQLFLPDKLWVLTLNPELLAPQFFNFLLKNERYREVVRGLASGGHDSMLNISMKKFMTLNIPCPPVEIQTQFSVIVKKIEAIRSSYQQSLTDLESLYGALSQQAFKGELDLSRVPMPSTTQHIAPIPIGDQTTMPEPAVQAEPAIHLPDTESMLNALESAEARKGLIAQWLESYLRQIGNAPFSVQHFIAAAQTRLAELRPDDDFELGTNDYEHIKAWVFEALAAGTLTQVLDDAENRIELKVAQQ